MDVAGKKAVVLGGTSGIGLATVQALLAGGATVVAASRSDNNIASAKAATSGDVSFVTVDVRDRDAMSAMFESAAPFDILINAATGGTRATGPFLEMDIDGFKNSFDKLWGYVNSIRLGVPHLAADGVAVLVSGSPARKCNPGMSAISTVGNAVEGFARAVASEIAPRRLMVVSPGVIDTPMFPVQGEAREKFLAGATGNVLLKRAGTSEEVASGIMFAVANDYVTGSVIDVDGGALLP